MGRLFVEHLPDGRVYACKSCLATNPCQIVHLAPVADLISKNFHSRHGPAYLFGRAVNCTLGDPEEREMTTGRHVVRDLFCVSCRSLIGWKYEMAFEHQEKYKEGKYILERLALVDLEAAAAVGLGQLSANLNDTSSDAVGGLSDFSLLEGPGRPFRTAIAVNATATMTNVSTRPLLGLLRSGEDG